MAEKISRSEQKRLFKQVEKLAAELAELSDNDLKSFPCNEEIKEEIALCRACKAGARKRQVKYLAKLLRQQDTLKGMYEWMNRRKGSQLKQNQLVHQAERWRDVLINEAMELNDLCRAEQVPLEVDYPSEMIPQLQAELPSLDIRDVKRSAYQYVRSRNKSHYRELYRMIKAALELQERIHRDNGA